jgi:hypothetical protein
MTQPERWIFELIVPAGAEHPGRLGARALKMLWSAFGLRATAFFWPNRQRMPTKAAQTLASCTKTKNRLAGRLRISDSLESV